MTNININQIFILFFWSFIILSFYQITIFLSLSLSLFVWCVCVCVSVLFLTSPRPLLLHVVLLLRRRLDPSTCSDVSFLGDKPLYSCWCRIVVDNFSCTSADTLRHQEFHKQSSIQPGTAMNLWSKQSNPASLIYNVFDTSFDTLNVFVDGAAAAYLRRYDATPAAVTTEATTCFSYAMLIHWCQSQT